MLKKKKYPGILKGGDHAATDYLKRTSYDALAGLYHPKIQGSLNEKLVGDLCAQQSWNELTGRWNTVASSAIGQMANLESLETDLSSLLCWTAVRASRSDESDKVVIIPEQST